jgi:hypothetical protein
MTTALPLAFRKDILLERSEELRIVNAGDLSVVAAFAVIGIALTIGLTVFFPQAANAIALALAVA